MPDKTSQPQDQQVSLNMMPNKKDRHWDEFGNPEIHPVPACFVSTEIL
jgi:hypothetical protein